MAVYLKTNSSDFHRLFFSFFRLDTLIPDFNSLMVSTTKPHLLISLMYFFYLLIKRRFFMVKISEDIKGFRDINYKN